MGQQGWRTDQQSGMFWLDAWVFRADRTMRERGPTCAFNAGCSSNEDSGSTAAVVASAVAAAAVRKLGALWSLLAETVQKPRWRLPLVGQLSPLRAGWLAAELNLCWGWIAEGGVLGGRLQYDVPMSGNTGGHCGMVLAGASFHTLGLQSSRSVPSGDRFVAACWCFAVQGDGKHLRICRLRCFPHKLIAAVLVLFWRCKRCQQAWRPVHVACTIPKDAPPLDVALAKQPSA